MRPYDTDSACLRKAGLDDRNPWDAKKHPSHYRYIQSIIDRLDKETIRPPKYTHETKLEVFRLRDQGYTLRQIADEVGVSKSTACLYIQKKKRLEAQTATVRQPGTTKTIETHYSVNEINIGKIRPRATNSGASNARRK